MLLQALYFGFRVGEISCPALYEEDSSSIGLRRSIVYGFGVLGTAVRFRAARWGLLRPRIFDGGGRRLAWTGDPTAEPAAAGAGGRGWAAAAPAVRIAARWLPTRRRATTTGSAASGGR